MSPVDDPGRLAAEQRARVLIDQQLEAAGWVVQDKKDLNLFAGPGIAVREVVMKPGHGRVDYCGDLRAWVIRARVITRLSLRKQQTRSA
jgi:hypothetical protein